MNRSKEGTQLIKLVVDLYLADVIREVEKKKEELIYQNDAGNCPVCGNYDESIVDGETEFVFCHKHKKKWAWEFRHYSKTQWERMENGCGDNWKKNSKKLKKYEHYENVNGNKWLDEILHPESRGPNELPF